MDFLVKIHTYCKNNLAEYTISYLPENRIEIKVGFIIGKDTFYLFRTIGAEVCPVEVDGLFRFLDNTKRSLCS